MTWLFSKGLHGSPNSQKLTFNQLSTTQFVQGFTNNILEEKDDKMWEFMLSYLSDHMADTMYIMYIGPMPRRTQVRIKIGVDQKRMWFSKQFHLDLYLVKKEHEAFGKAQNVHSHIVCR